MKTSKFLLVSLFVMLGMTVQAQTVVVYKDGKVIDEFQPEQVDSVVYTPKIDRNVYSNEQATKILFANAIQPAGSITVGAAWDKSKAITIPVNQFFISTRTKFKLYNESLDGTIEFNKNCQTDLAPIYYVTDIAGGSIILEELK